MRRARKVRIKITKNTSRKRLSVFRSNRFFYAQIIDDKTGKTLVAVSEKELERKEGLTKTQVANALGMLMGKKSKEAKIDKIVFDRGGYQYHGRVKAFAEGVRAEGLKF